ncbi:Glutathione S-transferase [Rubellimicrobium mesophilum DSM 19309]|uniref:Glutathione S-transferase n=1 Tax=Rubellimicrobium mesophilum DSM 19309 TaxID=442562 RepID=A0A017HVM2_9RHOB|nr:glutathione S-transferase [Rubellimicrobium mesophilum]EYD78375.1 Glutathione S-transferase [Rubellimicrobium mesophilum DSM 19309]
MALTLYTNPQSRGRIARWMLEEVGEPYEARILDFGAEMRTPEYLAINPMAKVPTLVHDGRVVTEVGAILGYLAEAFPAAELMPEDRAGFWRWMFFVAGPLEYAVTNHSMGFEAADVQQEGRLGYGSFGRVIETLKGELSVAGLPLRRWILGRGPLSGVAYRLRPPDRHDPGGARVPGLLGPAQEPSGGAQGAGG